MTGTTQIEAGRELDAFVAVEVFGWKWLEHFQTRGAMLMPPDRADMGLRDRLWYRTEKREGDTHDVARYSTTGNGMLAVLERMRELGWEWDISEVSSGPVGAEHTQYARAWSASLEAFSDDDGRFFISRADTLPHAVCLAALEAVRA